MALRHTSSVVEQMNMEEYPLREGEEYPLSWAWRKLKASVIEEEPTCQIAFPWCCTHVSRTVDHIIPRRNRPDLIMDRSNLQGACRPCHRVKDRQHKKETRA